MTDVLIVEDNAELAGLLCDFLMAEGYSVHRSGEGREALHYFEQEEVRLVILDLMLPGIDGFEVCRRIREEYNTPILMVTARTGKEEKLNGLLLGADDYIEKPYDIDILLAKIKGIFKRRYATENMLDGNLRVDREKRRVFREEKELELTAKEYDLLILFMEQKGKVLKKEWIFNQIWGYDSFSEPQTLTVHIKRLREKIEDNPGKPERILTVWGMGYRFE